MEPHLYKAVSKDKLFDIIKSLHTCFELPMQILSEDGIVLKTAGEPPQFCNVLEQEENVSFQCKEIYNKACLIAFSMGEPYIFSCPAGMYNIIIPLIIKETILGSLRIGPFLMNTPDSIFMTEVSKHVKLPVDRLFELADYAAEVPYLLPSKVTEISKLVFYFTESLVEDSRKDYETKKNKMHQQAKINESIQIFKSYGLSEASSYPYETEKKLVNAIRNKDTELSKALLNDLLGNVLFSKGSSIEYTKSRSLELISLLSRASIEGGAKAELVFKINNRFMEDVHSLESMDKLCYCLQQSIDYFIESMFYQVPHQNKKIVQKSIAYMAKHYSENITLEEIADTVHLNPSYFSTLFKNSTGTSFKEYLTGIRIEESKNLLENTNYSIIEIAIATGFANHSYFANVFRKYTGMTPKNYRK
ncbi:AraC family transcriptional regulator [Anaerobium acetethylicum]|uniref:Helix-turn-helix domain-containing protein n=1 Tax=Anaerobium acetethylicum TaxID=1619234 RepID=A0A1D3TYV1_9FIRM|nr:AraC family transcriptional regulator [Anaerobium acetethylicum]SCP99647.1 Helix-turn-helix domain-containing protein [Anaerobium acetethylicum]